MSLETELQKLTDDDLYKIEGVIKEAFLKVTHIILDGGGIKLANNSELRGYPKFQSLQDWQKSRDTEFWQRYTRDCEERDKIMGLINECSLSELGKHTRSVLYERHPELAEPNH